ncbi:MAG: glycosyltransferase [Verrucomicrobia bacterium]|nr:glycosyltransferase [Verrucomicrobiota bacterium]
MQLIIVHHHLRPGGVRRVIELATPHLVAHFPVRIGEVVLGTGEAPEPAWLKAFRGRLGGTPVRVQVQPAFGYVSEMSLRGDRLERRMQEAIMELTQRGLREGCLVWAHNLGLGRNLVLSRRLTWACDVWGIPMVAHHHDWWFENRWQHFGAMRDAGFLRLNGVARAVLADSACISHVAINRADAAVLARHFPGRAGWLPNPVERLAPPSAARMKAARGWLREQVGGEAPVWLLPCRLLRRKNIAEAVLLTRWLRPEAWLVTTGGVSSADEQPYAEALAGAAQAGAWRLRLGLLGEDEGSKPTVAELLAASEAVLLTSLQEGFGLPCLEAAAAGRPLIARRLPNIAPDLAGFGFRFPQGYREVRVDPSLFDWQAERQRQWRQFAAWKGHMPRAAVREVGTPALLALGSGPAPVPFSRLTLAAQLEVLAKPPAHSWARCAPLNPFLARWRKRAAAGALEAGPWPGTASRWLNGRAYARRFLEALPSLRRSPRRPDASLPAQTEFLRRKLRADHLYPLLWHSRT